MHHNPAFNAHILRSPHFLSTAQTQQFQATWPVIEITENVFLGYVNESAEINT